MISPNMSSGSQISAISPNWRMRWTSSGIQSCSSASRRGICSYPSEATTSSAVVNSTPASRQAAMQALVRSSSRPRAASSTKRTRRPRRRKPRIAASSQTSVATPKTTISAGSSASRSGLGVRIREDVEVLLQEQGSRGGPRRGRARGPAGNGRSASGNGSACSVSGILCAPRVPRRQCGGYVLRKSGSSEISGSVSSWSSAEATWTIPASRAASTSSSHRRRRLLGTRHVELARREHEVDLGVDVPEHDAAVRFRHRADTHE